MFTIPHTRKWILVLALPVLTITTIARADREADRARILAAIDSVEKKIDETRSMIRSLNGEILRIRSAMDEYKKLYEETKDDVYKEKHEEAAFKLREKLDLRYDAEVRIQEYYELLAQLEHQLEKLSG